jgi:hypothetical protein
MTSVTLTLVVLLVDLFSNQLECLSATDMRHPLSGCPKATGSVVGMNCIHRIMTMQIIKSLSAASYDGSSQ